MSKEKDIKELEDSITSFFSSSIVLPFFEEVLSFDFDVPSALVSAFCPDAKGKAKTMQRNK